MRHALWTTFVAGALALSAAGPVEAADVLYVKAGRLIVDAGRPAIVPGALVITDGVITAAGPNVTPPPGAREINLGALTVMPSLLDVFEGKVVTDRVRLP